MYNIPLYGVYLPFSLDRDILLSTKYERYCEYPCISFFFMDKQDGFLEVRLSMKYEPF